jgi:hypothetical protein
MNDGEAAGSEPRTAAGRALLAQPWWSARFIIYPAEVREAILAIEAEMEEMCRE